MSEQTEPDEQWEYRLAQLVLLAGAQAYQVLGADPQTGDDRLVHTNRFEEEGWMLAQLLHDAVLYDTEGQPLRGYGAVMLLKRRKP